MSYHIDTGLIKEKFAENSECPLCAIQKVAEEQFLHEFLNDAVMEDDTRIRVGKKGFCAKHFDMLFSRQNKLSVALQIGTRAGVISDLFLPVKGVGGAKKRAEQVEKSLSGCAVCDFLDESMVKYYKTVAQLFVREKSFLKTFMSCNGFCLHHYAELLRYSASAGFAAKEYVNALTSVQKRNFERVMAELKTFCDKHDYRNAHKPLGSAETALPRTRIKFYGEKPE